MRSFDEIWLEETQDIFSDMERRINENTSSLITKLIVKRTEMKITQRELAELSGIKQSAIARLERQGVVPRIDTLQKLAIVLDLKLDFVSTCQ